MQDALRSTTASNQRCRPDPERRLIRCFSAAFSDLGPEEIRRADTSSLREWDSLASMTLVILIEEEFELRILGQDLVRLTSFSNVLSYLAEAAG
jgi:acyl carrier protein